MKILSMRRIDRGDRVEVRAMTATRVLTYRLSADYLEPGDVCEPIEGIGLVYHTGEWQRGAHAIRTALAEYNRAYQALGPEDRLKQLLREATELCERRGRELNEHVREGSVMRWRIEERAEQKAAEALARRKEERV